MTGLRCRRRVALTHKSSRALEGYALVSITIDGSFTGVDYLSIICIVEEVKILSAGGRISRTRILG